MINADFTRNEKQIELLESLVDVLNGDSEIRNFFIGGAIRGGKTFVCLGALVILCKKYPGSRWHIVRESFPTLRSTTIPSVEKLLKWANVKWNRNSSDYFVQFPNGSRIYFFSENYVNDKDLDRFKGLETNGFLLEQIEELQEATFMKCMERCGSWYIDPMPAALNFATFNPSFNWVKDKIYLLAIAGLLPITDKYITALPTDNPFVTDDQWKAWDRLDDESKERFIMGNWELNVEGAFMHRFDRDKHLSEEIYFKEDDYVNLSFDFNVDPMTCTVYQTDGYTYHHTLKEYRVENSDTYEVCDRIKADFYHSNDLYKGTPSFKIRGDASGSNRMSGTRGHINHYEIIRTELGLTWQSFDIPTANPGISASRVFCNSILQHFQNVKIKESTCPYLVKDMMFCLSGLDSNGRTVIEKTGKNKFINMDNKMLGHLMDNWRYGVHTDLHNFIQIPKS
jgi:hypothetical protein